MTLESVAISTSKYIKTVNANIDGYVYTVHKMGAGTQLDLSREVSSLMRVRTDIMNLDARLKKAEGDAETDKIMAEVSTKMDELNKCARRVEDIFVSLFDDREDGKKSQKLIHALGIENAQRVYDEIWQKAEDEPTDA